MWNLPGPGIEPGSPALAGRFLSTRPPGKSDNYLLNKLLCVEGFPSVLVKNLPAMWETWVSFLGWEDTLKEGMAAYSSILAWRIPMDRGAWGTTLSMGSQRARHDWVTKHTRCVLKDIQCTTLEIYVSISKLNLMKPPQRLYLLALVNAFSLDGINVCLVKSMDRVYSSRNTG